MDDSRSIVRVERRNARLVAQHDAAIGAVVLEIDDLGVLDVDPDPAGTRISLPSMNMSRWAWTWLTLYSFGAGLRPASTVRSSGSDGAGHRSVGGPAGAAAAPLGVGAAPGPTLDRATTTAHTTATAPNRIGGVRMTVASELSLRRASNYAVSQAIGADMARPRHG